MTVQIGRCCCTPRLARTRAVPACRRILDWGSPPACWCCCWSGSARYAPLRLGGDSGGVCVCVCVCASQCRAVNAVGLCLVRHSRSVFESARQSVPCRRGRRRVVGLAVSRWGSLSENHVVGGLRCSDARAARAVPTGPFEFVSSILGRRRGGRGWEVARLLLSRACSADASRGPADLAGRSRLAAASSRPDGASPRTRRAPNER